MQHEVLAMASVQPCILTLLFACLVIFHAADFFFQN